MNVDGYRFARTFRRRWPGYLGVALLIGLVASVAWQSTVIAGMGVLIGVPVGVLVGRGLWTAFAQQLFVVVRPSVPLGPIALVAIGALVVANLVAAVPGWIAAVTPTAEILRGN